MIKNFLWIVLMSLFLVVFCKIGFAITDEYDNKRQEYERWREICWDVVEALDNCAVRPFAEDWICYRKQMHIAKELREWYYNIVYGGFVRTMSMRCYSYCMNPYDYWERKRDSLIDMCKKLNDNKFDFDE